MSYNPSAVSHLGTDIGGHGFIGRDGRWWSIGRLWRLSAELPIDELPIESPLLDLDGPNNLLTEFADRPPTNRDIAERARRIYTADLRYPVILSADGWRMDGAHRIMKAWATGAPTVKTVRFEIDPEPDQVGDPATWAGSGAVTF